MFANSALNRSTFDVNAGPSGPSTVARVPQGMVIAAFAMLAIPLLPGRVHAQSVRESVRQWAVLEVDELQRLVRNQKLDEARIRKELSNLKQQRTGLVSFCNGISNGTTRAALLRSLNYLEQTPAMQELIKRELPPIPAEEFICHRKLSGIIDDNGSLVGPPPALNNTSQSIKIGNARQTLETQWEHVRYVIRNGHSLSNDQVISFQKAVENYSSIAASVLAGASCGARVAGNSYLELLKGIARRVETSSGQKTLRLQLLREGVAFPGGTVAKLINHVVQNDLSVCQGGKAHASLAEIGRGLTPELDQQIDLAEQRIEAYKAQNIAQNSAVKIRLAWTVVPQGPVGLNSHAYGNSLPIRTKRYGGAEPFERRVSGATAPVPSLTESEADREVEKMRAERQSR